VFFLFLTAKTENIKPMFNVSKKPKNYTPEELFSELKSIKIIDCLASLHQ
jgi:hypothetical protein